MISNHKIKLGASVVLIIGVIALIYFSVLSFANESTQHREPNLLAGITFADSISDADAAYLQTSMQWLHDYAPEWYAYVAQAKPFTLSLDVELGKSGLAARAKCCDERKSGEVIFGDHFGDWTTTNDPEDQTMWSRQITFLSTLIHEVTHVYDQRAGRVPKRIELSDCLSFERAAYSKELEFKRALLSIMIGDKSQSGAMDRRILERQIRHDEIGVSRESWTLFCAMATPTDYVPW
ncbi:MAG: hypothetical protein HY868_11695 [Chloroflexi bacterium]|nr:hypothetical protein [Chloroflexota bacterium]